jgi:hypothetical protein
MCWIGDEGGEQPNVVDSSQRLGIGDRDESVRPNSLVRAAAVVSRERLEQRGPGDGEAPNRRQVVPAGVERKGQGSRPQDR